MPRDSWYLMQKDTVLGRLTNPRLDMPLVFCAFEPTQEFEAVRPLFDEQLRLVNNDQIDEFVEIDKKIQRLKLRLKPTSGGRSIRYFLLHVDGKKAWFQLDISKEPPIWV